MKAVNRVKKKIIYSDLGKLDVKMRFQMPSCRLIAEKYK